jgi:hypothetical protein
MSNVNLGVTSPALPICVGVLFAIGSSGCGNQVEIQHATGGRSMIKEIEYQEDANSNRPRSFEEIEPCDKAGDTLPPDNRLSEFLALHANMANKKIVTAWREEPSSQPMYDEAVAEMSINFRSGVGVAHISTKGSMKVYCLKWRAPGHLVVRLWMRLE